MPGFRENIERLIRNAVVERKGNTVSVDIGEVPMNDPAVLVFPEGTFIRVDGVARETQKDELFPAKTWCSGLNMTWGNLATDGEPYFKALDYPSEILEPPAS